MAEIHLGNGPVACTVHTTCRTCRDHPCPSHLLEHHQCSGSSVPVEVEAVEVMILTEITEVVLPDGPMMTIILVETTIDGRIVGILAGALPGAWGTTGWTTRRQPSSLAHATA